jgi:heptaprenyl diphosphate synthase
VIADKTGSLIATSARYGAMFAGASTRDIEILTQYGEKIGILFQLADDIIDIASESAESGKTPGTDLREGVPTMVTVHILESNAAEDADLKKVLSAPIHDEAIVEKTLLELRTHRAMDISRELLIQYANEAKTLVSDLRDGAAKEALISLCDAIITRTA